MLWIVSMNEMIVMPMLITDWSSLLLHSDPFFFHDQRIKMHTMKGNWQGLLLESVEFLVKLTRVTESFTWSCAYQWTIRRLLSDLASLDHWKHKNSYKKIRYKSNTFDVKIVYQTKYHYRKVDLVSCTEKKIRSNQPNGHQTNILIDQTIFSFLSKPFLSHQPKICSHPIGI